MTATAAGAEPPARLVATRLSDAPLRAADIPWAGLRRAACRYEAWVYLASGCGRVHHQGWAVLCLAGPGLHAGSTPQC